MLRNYESVRRDRNYYLFSRLLIDDGVKCRGDKSFHATAGNLAIQFDYPKAQRKLLISNRIFSP